MTPPLPPHGVWDFFLDLFMVLFTCSGCFSVSFTDAGCLNGSCFAAEWLERGVRGLGFFYALKGCSVFFSQRARHND